MYPKTLYYRLYLGQVRVTMGQAMRLTENLLFLISYLDRKEGSPHVPIRGLLPVLCLVRLI